LIDYFFKSGFAELEQKFVEYRKASGVWNDGYMTTLKIFDNYCAKNYPNGTFLCQSMIDEWCQRHENEKNRSRNTRVRVIRAFVRFVNERTTFEFEEPTRLKPEPITYIPHAFSTGELERFFTACDNIPISKDFKSVIYHFTCPVLFRLLYSSGIRTTEARYLRRTDFIRDGFVLNIKKSKGYDQHYVALHMSMAKLLIKYDIKMEEYQPNRIYLFESPNGGAYKKEWVTQMFKLLWTEANGDSTNITPYQLRHHYAIANINSWNNEDSFEFSDKLNKLSKSMGHRHIASTLGYYSLVPRLADTLLEKTEDSFNNLISEVIYE